jgi:hypothetical protein
VDQYIGKNVFIRTVTHYYTGRLEAVEDGFLHLEQAAWVADTGRFGEALAKGTLSEVEPYPSGCAVSLGAVVDVSIWQHDLPDRVR